MDLGEHAQFLTWRLADALPVALLTQWKEELQYLSDEELRKTLWKRIEDFVDRGYGSEILKNPRIADIVQEAFLFGHGKRYELHHWCVMPNHVHVLLTPRSGTPLKTIVKSIKSFTAHRINAAQATSGQIWQQDYFDRWMRSEEHFERTARYIEWNPVKAGLCPDPKLWAWSSAHEICQSRLASTVAGRDVRSPDADGTSALRL